ncbi:hypothetical protein CY34DRAFT_797745 [Suillus luteus UH-Slu-Lm8-n1]|uniref:Uncharacterized protein n=1 Tax=Suillus luteus UH-Slu-Lm8-n1 TaxID=930992 RepID=A0A0D0BH46_9AGAM|nr:hypothetical protein CY34DRAFT_797745 [Suillus luteus UH-Slu-Lm8-n1]
MGSEMLTGTLQFPCVHQNVLASDILSLVRATIHTRIFDFNSFSRVRTTSQSFYLAPLAHV